MSSLNERSKQADDSESIEECRGLEYLNHKKVKCAGCLSMGGWKGSKSIYLIGKMKSTAFL